MTHRQMVLETLRTFGPLSDYGIYHAARARGWRMSPSSVRTRRHELELENKVYCIGSEPTPTSTARVFRLSH